MSEPLVLRLYGATSQPNVDEYGNISAGYIDIELEEPCPYPDSHSSEFGRCRGGLLLTANGKAILALVEKYLDPDARGGWNHGSY